MDLQYRPTVWPGSALPVPTVRVPSQVERVGYCWLYLRGEPREVELPVDFYLREPAEVDYEDVDALIDFTTRWGRFGHVLNSDIGGIAIFEHLELQAQERGWLHDSYITERGRLADGLELGREAGAEDWRPQLVNVFEVRERIRRLRRLGDHVALWQLGEDVAEAWTDVWADESPWWLFEEHLNLALTAFQARVTITDRPSIALAPVTGFSAGALQLFNDLSVATPWHICANERCPHGGVFTRQRGRSEYGQHRTVGLKYCSRECAKAQAARERRRRDKKEQAQ